MLSTATSTSVVTHWHNGLHAWRHRAYLLRTWAELELQQAPPKRRPSFRGWSFTEDEVKNKNPFCFFVCFLFYFYRPWVKPRGHQFTDNNHQQPHRWGLSEKNGAITTAGQDLGFLLLLFNCQNMFPVIVFFSVFFNNEPPVLKFFFSFIFCC